MSTVFEEAQQLAEKQFTRFRWALGLSGALSIALGVVIVVWPDISLHALVLVFGAFALARGIVGLVVAFSGPMPYGRGWMVFWSLVSAAVGVLVLVYPDISALALLYVIGAYAIVLGATTIWGAFALPVERSDSLLLAFTGLIGIVFGVVMFAKPEDGAIVLLALIAAYVLVIGVSEVAVAIGAKRFLKEAGREYPAATTAKPQVSR